MLVFVMTSLARENHNLVRGVMLTPLRNWEKKRKTERKMFILSSDEREIQRSEVPQNFFLCPRS